MKYHSDTLVPHKSAVMACPANLLAEEVCLPAALVKKTALENNIAWMQRYADTRGVSLAPHGKTTMTPWIFQAQQRAGAWGIGVGSAWQASAAMASGIERVLMVNQLVGQANMQVVSQLKAHYRAVDFLCCVDSLANARTLSAFFSARQQTLDVLIELGVPGGRCGCRSVDAALALAQEVATLPGLTLRGLELYEGVLHGDDPQPQVEALLRQAAGLACQMAPLVEGEFILTGAGTVWYDVVCNVWLAAQKPDRCRVVIRPGCYITHDVGIYEIARQELIARDPIACDLGGDLTSALELMAMVQSVPEADRAVVNFGKRDCAFDAGLPQPVAHYRHGKALPLQADEIVSVGIMDQHCMLRLAPGCDVQVGDIVLFGTSHPCLTFDKWKTLLLVDDEYNVLEELDTLF
ncbi:TPA: amino acid deaminase [Raoultella ornithinolytica]|jgi:D-serine deaminase-like pyridoxal phosphate-dependent protein|uniref:amino acid deaminase n=1 Tax=Raoultella TaxID=160674 RepID=UPI0004D4C49F|nr:MULTISPECIES: amino acid deaminase [Raoultella]EKR9385471.1 amino acid deaminase [Raoultella ornithinolytica]KDV96473.1 putative D-serine deaminase protein [Raoultella ornithinolytica 2-156-04_S1_C1]KDX16541.1 putative D-serine deaminase protein [Raoultella ornithinolytica 2-156-04_S1_C2]MCF1306085.1 amino acid deaminase [Raoultella ornithinolytica]MCF6710371.1 amino acid deaminase [Raoultella ornithinolytica]